jgi:DNA processing protein
MTEREYLTAVSAFNYFGPARVNLLLSYFKSAKNVWLAKTSELHATGLANSKVLDFERFRHSFDVKSYFEKLKEIGAKVTTINDDNYPKNLKTLTDAPPVFYVRGKLKPVDENSVAIVGSRQATPYGYGVAERLSRELVKLGITIVSGLALGIDAVAQRTAYLSGGRTIAVLASGIDIISPLSNKDLALEFIKENGAVISEYPLGHTPLRSDFAIRNRLISGLAKGVVVIEGRMRSGTFYTVKAAAAQGRPVFAVPGAITVPTSEGPNYLIQSGAKLVMTVKDIIEELNLG